MEDDNDSTSEGSNDYSLVDIRGNEGILEENPLTSLKTSPNFAYGRSRGVDELYSSLPPAVYNEVAELRSSLYSSLPLAVYNEVAKLRSSLPPAVYNREVAKLRSSLPPAAYNREVEIAEYFTDETSTHFQAYLATNTNSSIRTID